MHSIDQWFLPWLEKECLSLRCGLYKIFAAQKRIVFLRLRSGLYYGFTIFIVSLATAMTVMTLNIHYNGSSGRPVPPLVRLVCFRWLRRLLCLKVTGNTMMQRTRHHNIIEVNFEANFSNENCTKPRCRRCGVVCQATRSKNFAKLQNAKSKQSVTVLATL